MRSTSPRPPPAGPRRTPIRPASSAAASTTLSDRASTGKLRRASGGREVAAAFLLFAAGTAFYLGPALSWRLAGQLGPDHGDPVFYVYLLKWIASRLPHGLAGVWDPPIFHPATGALALSDHFLGPGIAFGFLRAFGLPPLAAYNLLYASTFLFAGVACWWVLRRSGLSWLGAAFGGWFFAFGHFRWDEQSHFNVLRIAWIPLVLWTFDRLLAAPGWRRALLFLAVYATHLAGSSYLAYLIHFPLAILVVNRWRELDGLRREPRRARPLLFAAAVAALLLGALYWAYADRVAGFGARRQLDELRESSAVLGSFASASYRAPIARLLPVLAGSPQRSALFAGFAVLLGAGVALHSGWRRYRAPLVRRSGAALASSAGGAALIGSGLWLGDTFTLAGPTRLAGIPVGGYLGPLGIVIAGGVLLVASQRRLRTGRVVAWAEIPAWPRALLGCGLFSLAACLPLFFWPLWSSLPGMAGMRIPQRFFPFAALAIAFAAGRGFDLLRAKLASRSARAALVAVLAAVATLEQLPHLRPWAPLPEEESFPAYARFLADSPEVRLYVELPIYGDWRDLRSMYYQTLHWKPLVNGYSSFLTRAYTELADRCREPSPDCVERLRASGVSHVVVQNEPVLYQRLGKHGRKVERRRFEIWAPERVAARIAEGRLALAFESDAATIYRLAVEAAPASRVP